MHPYISPRSSPLSSVLFDCSSQCQMSCEVICQLLPCFCLYFIIAVPISHLQISSIGFHQMTGICHQKKTKKHLQKLI